MSIFHCHSLLGCCCSQLNAKPLLWGCSTEHGSFGVLGCPGICQCNTLGSVAFTSSSPKNPVIAAIRAFYCFQLWLTCQPFCSPANQGPKTFSRQRLLKGKRLLASPPAPSLTFALTPILQPCYLFPVLKPPNSLQWSSHPSIWKVPSFLFLPSLYNFLWDFSSLEIMTSSLEASFLEVSTLLFQFFQLYWGRTEK